MTGSSSRESETGLLDHGIQHGRGADMIELGRGLGCEPAQPRSDSSLLAKSRLAENRRHVVAYLCRAWASSALDLVGVVER